jgi:hypothetical protein
VQESAARRFLRGDPFFSMVLRKNVGKIEQKRLDHNLLLSEN